MKITYNDNAPVYPKEPLQRAAFRVSPLLLANIATISAYLLLEAGEAMEKDCDLEPSSVGCTLSPIMKQTAALIITYAAGTVLGVTTGYLEP